MAIEFKLPELGEDVETGEVINVLVADGDRIEPDQSVIEIETGKATLEVPCPHGGIVRNVRVRVGDTLEVGAILFEIDAAAPEDAGDAAPADTTVDTTDTVPEALAEPPPPPAKAPPPAEPSAPPPPAAKPSPPSEPGSPASAPERQTVPEREPGSEVVKAGPAVRRIARELGVDLQSVAGTGRDGRITEDDVKAHVQASMKSRPEPVGLRVDGSLPPLPDFTEWGEVERKPMSTVRRMTAEHMSLSWRLIPHVTQFEDIDATELEAFRKRYAEACQERGGKLTVTVLVLKAVTTALKQFPEFNASLDPNTGEIIYKAYYHIGVAADTERGLMVPVIRDVDKKDIFQLAKELTETAERVRAGKVDMENLQGGTFTISNLGGIAGTGFTPIINYPEVCILGISRSRIEPRTVDEEISPRLILPICISYDHRVIDGAQGARFIKTVAESIADPERLILGL